MMKTTQTMDSINYLMITGPKNGKEVKGFDSKKERKKRRFINP